MKESPKMFEEVGQDESAIEIVPWLAIQTQLNDIEDEISRLRDKGVVSTEEFRQFTLKRAVIEAIQEPRVQAKEGKALLNTYRMMVGFRQEQEKKNGKPPVKKKKSA